jgi:hypothetical protein
MNHLKTIHLLFLFILPTIGATSLITQYDVSNPAENCQIERWNIIELKLDGTQKGNPFVDISLSAEFKNGDKTYSPSGFYDGNGVYKVRFMPTELGKWKFITKSNNKALDGIKGSFTCVESCQNCIFKRHISGCTPRRNRTD